ncbi:TIGR03862 family flavoprotein [Noviherbaspirillum pedocola]|uniref:TIGR03862 family flavoprotein n=1 Tax=Noviherbaspirillum pedocola TaxID=2801341 RepID=A0A934SWS9_9BURK|nr:TIGR03862 family flavoprotein [Noviherbaspirillum pedocola]MBK4737197.1 TIGR03862 family flavoprotein [Noviherbaspirillum pedocola]
MTSMARHAAIIGGGPAGLMAAEALAEAGVRVDLFDAMPSVGRKFLLAGRGGLNLTHSEPKPTFLQRFGMRQAQLAAVIDGFDADALRAWCASLGVETFVGSSGRVFPKEMKAAPLLRAWLHRLRSRGVRFHMRHRWLGWEGAPGAGPLRFATEDGLVQVPADATLLALGGASWKRLGSDGAWVPWLEAAGVDVAPLVPANCGFDVAWSAHFRERFAGHPVKAVIARCNTSTGVVERQGEFVVTEQGVEGSLIYALSAPLRDAIAAEGSATLTLDLAPGRDATRLTAELTHPRGSRSLSSHLQSRSGIAGVKAGLLREVLTREQHGDMPTLAAAIKSLPLRLDAPRPIDEAISSAGGVRFDSLNDDLMLHRLPGVFCAGEMLDWEAPTGGYLLTASMASGRHAGRGMLDWLGRQGGDGTQ